MALSTTFSVTRDKGCEERFTRADGSRAEQEADTARMMSGSREVSVRCWHGTFAGAQRERRPTGKEFGRRGMPQADGTTSKISLANRREGELDQRWDAATAWAMVLRIRL